MDVLPPGLDGPANMPATIQTYNLTTTDAVNELTITATDGRTVVLTRAEVQAWFTSNPRGGRTLAQWYALAETWANGLLTERWNALTDVVPLSIWIHIFSHSPVDIALTATPFGVSPPLTPVPWWYRRPR